MALVGLKDDYRHEGRVLAEVLDRGALPEGFGDVDSYVRLSQVYEQINAPVGQFGRATLTLSTTALESSSDAVFQADTKTLTDLGATRDQIATEMQEQLDRSVSTVRNDGDHEAASTLETRGLDLLQQAWLASSQ